MKKIPLYEAGQTGRIKLSANENPLGSSPQALKAFLKTSKKLHVYPEPRATSLCVALAKRWGVQKNQILCGAGSDELLFLLAQTYLKQGDEVICARHGFLAYPIAAQAFGANVVFVGGWQLHVEEILNAVTSRTRMVFLANPNNPTGTYLTARDLRALHAALPATVVLVLDAAYAEYVVQKDYESGITLVREGLKNVVMTRTFSKIYGLAALRVGWAMACESVVEELERRRLPFSVSTVGICAALAALRDDGFVEASCGYNARWRSWLAQEIRAVGVGVEEGVANFLVLQLAHQGQADALYNFLEARGFVLRKLAGYGLSNSLRLSVGLEEHNRALVALIREFVS